MNLPLKITVSIKIIAVMLGKEPRQNEIIILCFRNIRFHV
jgi:hypothetical protein